MDNDTRYEILLRAIDENMVGFVLDGWEIKQIHRLPTEDEPDTIYHRNRYSNFDSLTRNMPEFKYIYKSTMDNPDFIYFEKYTNDITEFEPIISTMRLIKINEVGSHYPMPYSKTKPCTFYRTGEFFSRKNMLDIPKFSLTPQEKLDIEELYKKIKTFYTLQQKSDDKTLNHIKNMLDLFHESYRTANPEVAFIIRVTILEMLIDDKLELSYKLSLYIAILLGKNKKESTEIFENCKKIYSARSDFLHNGKKKKITSELQFLALDYSRRMIANLINITFEIQEKEKNEQEEQHKQRQKQQKKSLDWILEAIRSELKPENFGDNPFNVKF